MTVVTSASAAKDSQLHPVILIPGAGGNQLEARLTAKYSPSGLLCNRCSFPLKKECDGWFRIWFDPWVLLKPFAKCFNTRMTIYYDPDADDYHNAPGVETRVPHFGSTQSLLYLDPRLKYYAFFCIEYCSHRLAILWNVVCNPFLRRFINCKMLNFRRATSYMEPLVTFLEEAGYTSGENLFGAPYDFRYALAARGHPSEVASKFLQDLRILVESSSRSNGGKPVILLSHSLGGLFVLHFLNRNSNSWRQKYVKHWIALSTPWGGTVDVMRTFASGSTFGVPLVDPLVVRGHQRSSATNLWLMPSPKVFNHTKPLVITPDSSYDVLDIPRFLGDIGFPEGVQPYEMRVLPLVNASLTAPPLVPVTCITGSEVRTPETLHYGDHGFYKSPEIEYGDGDGTVNMVSLLALQSASKDQILEVIKLPGVTHTSILKEESSLHVIIRQISSLNSHLSTTVS
ncbi:hypothetical protein F511_13682 [Dorcoceras hygrometricum]|uniref:Lecithin-cholesterol acyltransferase-like 1 n=1 Tax=Dorcoceras hygrometricum TaxID=472368 RepID=A0A2Z7B5N6_9LAMI|nr:hypothetical protein F511_13682 [Dorcoceras hygrometricum]